jgi:hypothetical protein
MLLLIKALHALLDRLSSKPNVEGVLSNLPGYT